MPIDWSNVGMQAASAVTGGVLGTIFGGINDARQLRQQEKLQALQIAGQKQMVDYNMSKELQMWHDTNYSAQIAEMNKANVNPALLYGMKGGGGITTGNPTGTVSGGEAPKGGNEMIATAAMGMQLQLLKAQKENIEADTANKQADTTKKSGVDTTLTETQTASLQAQQELLKIQTNIAQIEEDIKGATQNAAKAMIMYTLNQSYQQLQILKNNKEISDATVQDQIKMIKEEAIGAYLRNQFTKAQTSNTNQDTKNKVQQLLNDKQAFTNMVGELMMAWNRDGRDAARLILQQNTNMNEAEYNPILQVLDGIMPVLPIPGGKANTPIKGFHNR